jgi:putative addiction module component (TIGR02574 family)
VTDDFESIANAALALPAVNRAALAERLLESLAEPDQSEIDAAWAEEAERRLAAYQQGSMKAIPAEEVMHLRRKPGYWKDRLDGGQT